MPSLEFKLQKEYSFNRHEVVQTRHAPEFVYDLLHKDGARYHTRGMLWSKVHEVPLIPLNILTLTQYALSQSTLIDFLTHPLKTYIQDSEFKQSSSQFLRSILGYTDDIHLTQHLHGVNAAGSPNELKRTLQLPSQNANTANAVMQGYVTNLNSLFASHQLDLPYIVTPSLQPEPEFYPRHLFF